MIDRVRFADPISSSSSERRTEQSVSSGSNWLDSYARRLAWSDLAVVVWAVFATQAAWLEAGFFARVAFTKVTQLDIPYFAVSVALSFGWMLTLRFAGARSSRIVAEGPDEYRAVIRASFSLFAVIAIVGYCFQIEFARGYVFIALPAGTLALLVTRWLWRQWLYVQRVHDRWTFRTMLIGSRAEIATIRRDFQRARAIGYNIVAQCVTDGASESEVLPTTESIEDAIGLIQACKVDTVIVGGGAGADSKQVKELSWRLEPGRHRLIFAPSLTDISGPRVITRPVAGLPLMHVDVPKLGPGAQAGKRVFDVLASVVLIALLSPVLVVVALAVKFSSPGGTLFRQTRAGLDGQPFRMLKFRSMIADAENMHHEIAHTDGVGNTVMFKLREDPRVTTVGRFIRRFSLDELPQLFNVLVGDMSLVGPRPPLPSEVAEYDDHVHRRFLVKPGITGLWQVSGRSTLTWDETVRLDLYYVENWSFAGDLVLLLRTVRAVFARVGAY